jgi:hypothetical protein
MNFLRKDITILPKIAECKRIFQAVAMLDAILMPEWEYRYFSFNSKWDVDQMMASMRDGGGDDFYGLFCKNGLIIKGFERFSPSDKSHASCDVNETNLYKGVPIEFKDFLNEPAFEIHHATFCVWNTWVKEVWEATKTYKKSELYLLNVLLEGPKGYINWASRYYEKEICSKAVQSVFDFEPIDQDLVSLLNSDITLEDITEDAIEIDYPILK